MSKPERFVLAIATLGACLLVATMMKRALDFQTQLNVSSNPKVEEARIPLPSGPRRFR